MPTCLGRVDLVPRHKLLWLRADRASDFSVWACPYFSSSVHKLYTTCKNIGCAHENFCRVRNFLEPRARWACKPNACMSSPAGHNEILNFTLPLYIWSKFCDPGLNGSKFIMQTSSGLTHGRRHTHRCRQRNT